MSESLAEHMRKHVKVYMAVGSALFVLTVVTVLVSSFHFTVALAVAIGLLIAIVKGSLVALYFMHLSNERKVIYWTMLLAAVFFFVLILVPLFAFLGGSGGPTTYVP
jgi:cytochrome c oxidase subunit 4